MGTSKDKILKEYADKINEIASQDAVRAAAVTIEVNDGTAEESIRNVAWIFAKTEQELLSQGVNPAEAMYLASRYAGIEVPWSEFLTNE